MGPPSLDHKHEVHRNRGGMWKPIRNGTAGGLAGLLFGGMKFSVHLNVWSLAVIRSIGRGWYEVPIREPRFIFTVGKSTVIGAIVGYFYSYYTIVLK